MQKFFYTLLAVLVISTNLSAQEEIIQEHPTPGKQENIWENQPTNIFDNQDANSKTKPLNPSPIPAPIDGGVIALLAAGALYGKRKIDQRKKANL